MATVNDIDTQQAVGKFLQRQSVTPRADNQANTADEIDAVLETIAMAFLLYPQAVLTLVMNAKNSFQQVVQADQAVLDFMISALADINNRDVPITSTSDLTEAQTALVELDKIGRVSPTLQAFSRYQDAINSFLNNQLAPTLKRNGTGTFERTGDEARQDLFNILPQFVATHGVTITLLNALQGSIDDFESVNLTDMVSSTTISRVRASLNRVKSRVDAGTVSKTTVAIELLSGAASLASISSPGGVFDPAIQTGLLPTGTTLQGKAQDVEAFALSTVGPWTLGVGTWKFAGTMDPLGAAPKAFNFEIPGTGASNRAYVSSEGLGATFNIVTNGTLYLRLNGLVAPDIEIALTSGPAVAIATLVSDINTALGSNGSCIKNPGTNGFLIFGSTSVTSISVNPASTGGNGVFNTHPSVHTVLGFTDNQTSTPIGQFTAASLALAIHNQLPSGVVDVLGQQVRITSSNSDSTTSSIFFDALATNAVQGSFGFTGTKESQPSYVEIVSGSTAQDPAGLGVYIGSTVTMVENPAISGSALRTLNNAPISDIQGTQLIFDPALAIPRGVQSITVTSPLVVSVQKMVRVLAAFLGTFDKDVAVIQRVLSPIVSSPTAAQIGDANRALQGVKTKLGQLETVLESFVVRADRSQFASVAAQVLSALEERGLDRAQELLSSGQFSAFFALDSSNASKSNRLLTAMETVANQDLPVSIVEADIDDDQIPRGTNPDSTLLPGAELQGTGLLVTD